MDGRLALAFTEQLRDWQDFEPAKQFCREMIKDALLAADEIDRLCAEKRRALALADERAIEANGVRAENERLRRTETCARLVLKAWETAGAATAQPLTDSIVRLRDALDAEQKGDGK